MLLTLGTRQGSWLGLAWPGAAGRGKARQERGQCKDRGVVRIEDRLGMARRGMA